VKHIVFESVREKIKFFDPNSDLVHSPRHSWHHCSCGNKVTRLSADTISSRFLNVSAIIVGEISVLGVQ